MKPNPHPPPTVVFFHLAHCKSRVKEFLSLASVVNAKPNEPLALVRVAYCESCGIYQYTPVNNVYQEQWRTADEVKN